MGYFLVIWSLLSYGALGICHKLAERKRCRPKYLSASLMLAAFVGMNVLVLAGHGGYKIAPPAFYVAIACGSVALCALWSFQEGLKRGKIATSWLIINLSSAIPTIGSIVIYQEPVNLRKLSIIGLIFLAIVFIWKDGLEDLRKLEREHSRVDFTSPASARTGDVSIERQI